MRPASFDGSTAKTKSAINSTSGARVKANKNGELIINNVQLSDGGTYECRGLEYTKYFTIYVNGMLSEC